MFASNKEKQFFNDWYFRAQLDENFDPDRQFFYFYALFDHLFKTYANEHEKQIKLQGLKFENTERSRLKYFLFNIFYIEPEKKIFETFNPLATLKSGNKTKLIAQLKINENDTILSTFKLPSFEVISDLFMAIYDIRCNLFHGNANLSDFDNNKLIDEANVVLKCFLEKFLNKDV